MRYPVTVPLDFVHQSQAAVPPAAGSDTNTSPGGPGGRSRAVGVGVGVGVAIGEGVAAALLETCVCPSRGKPASANVIEMDWVHHQPDAVRPDGVVSTMK